MRLITRFTFAYRVFIYILQGKLKHKEELLYFLDFVLLTWYNLTESRKTKYWLENTYPTVFNVSAAAEYTKLYENFDKIATLGTLRSEIDKTCIKTEPKFTTMLDNVFRSSLEYIQDTAAEELLDEYRLDSANNHVEQSEIKQLFDNEKY